MAKLNQKTVALSVGLFSALMHTLAVLGMRVGLLKLWGWAHLVAFQYVLEPFRLVPFLGGMLLAFGIGSVAGLLFASVYNAVNKL